MSKTALITGASRGIGRAIAHQLACEGYELFLVCHTNMQLLTDFSTQLTKDFQVICHCFQGDVADSSFVTEIFSTIPALDVLVNNAGQSYIGLLSDMSNEDWHRILNTNLSSVFYTCREASSLMLKAHAGKIINISSVWGNVGASMEVAYCASKGGMNALTKALAKELAPSNIQVNAIACGVIDTDMNCCFSEEEMYTLKTEIPADRIGTPEEVAQLVSQVIHAPSYLTGQIIALDGGWQ